MAAGVQRATAGEAGQRRVPGGVDERRPEPYIVTPRAFEAEAGQPDHDGAGVRGVYLVPAESELLHDPHREVLDHDVGGLQQLEEQLPAPVASG
jgi:hypothetical protein